MISQQNGKDAWIQRNITEGANNEKLEQKMHLYNTKENTQQISIPTKSEMLNE